ncbi:cytochrome c peroxidase [Halobacteriovorax sp. HFRX-2_2]|uniref:cytochrome-c peroxidase n=1 Tax=unclassified Halobacteriovorax TaxID=2639665 RepID=UPI0037230BF1
MKTLFILTIVLGAFAAQADQLDIKLKRYISDFRLKAVEKPKGRNPQIFKLGQELFNEKEISGNRNISCADCHRPEFGSGDKLPVGIGEGGKWQAGERLIANGHAIPRNSQPLYNLGDKNIEFLFWDGRVHYRKDWDVYTTPVKALNGDYPERWDITENLGSALAAQALFPITSHEEMRGVKGSNDIANAVNEEAVWKIVMKRLLAMPKYQKLFKEAFPKTPKAELNIGHFGQAIAHFETHEFAAYNTGWDKYLRGERMALNQKAKRGAVIFFENGSCFSCHSGDLLGGRGFFSVASPQIGPGKNDPRKNDEGRFNVTKRDFDRYQFRVPPLRNIALTGPYFHAGAYGTLEEVVDHYNNGIKSIDTYDSSWVENTFLKNFGRKLFVETNNYMNFKKKNAADTILKDHLIRLNNSQKSDLVYFLKYGLTDEKDLDKIMP